MPQWSLSDQASPRKGGGKSRTKVRCFVTLMCVLAVAACGKGLPGLDGYDLRVAYADGSAWYDDRADQHAIYLNAMVVNDQRGDGRLEHWSFSLTRRGETVAIIDASNVAGSEFDISHLDDDLGDDDGVSVNLLALRPGRAFYGVDPPDRVVFRCSVDRDRGGSLDLTGEGAFEHTEP
jgi:hypothetical protein